MEESRLLEVAVPIPVDTTCEYRLPGGMEAPPGVRVMVPYRGRQVAGFVLGPANPESGVDPDRIRAVTSVVDREPVFDEDLLGVVLQAARESLCPPGIALRSHMCHDFVGEALWTLHGLGVPFDPAESRRRLLTRDHIFLYADALTPVDDTKPDELQKVVDFYTYAESVLEFEATVKKDYSNMRHALMRMHRWHMDFYLYASGSYWLLDFDPERFVTRDGFSSVCLV